MLPDQVIRRRLVRRLAREMVHNGPRDSPIRDLPVVHRWRHTGDEFTTENARRPQRSTRLANKIRPELFALSGLVINEVITFARGRFDERGPFGLIGFQREHEYKSVLSRRYLRSCTDPLGEITDAIYVTLCTDIPKAVEEFDRKFMGVLPRLHLLLRAYANHSSIDHLEQTVLEDVTDTTLLDQSLEAGFLTLATSVDYGMRAGRQIASKSPFVKRTPFGVYEALLSPQWIMRISSCGDRTSDRAFRVLENADLETYMNDQGKLSLDFRPHSEIDLVLDKGVPEIHPPIGCPASMAINGESPAVVRLWHWAVDTAFKGGCLNDLSTPQTLSKDLRLTT